MKIGICVIAYNRIDSLKRVLKSLENAYYNNDVELIVSIDKSNTTVVEDYAKNYKWEHGKYRYIVHDSNLGLRRHVLKCGDLLNEFDALIVLEDDIYVAPNFYNYSLQCINKYKDNKDIAGISLYSFPINYHNKQPFRPISTDSDVFLMQNAQSWGQIWLKRQWEDFKKWYNSHNEEFTEQSHLPCSICSWPKSSWLKYHIKYCIENKKYFVYPYISLSTCFSDIGEHTGSSSTSIQAPIIFGEKKTYNLTPVIKYDAFFENENLYDILNIPPKDICVDFYGEKRNRENKRYWLTRELLPYKVKVSYALMLKPYEMNIIHDIKGNEIFVYDTNVSAPKPTGKLNNKLWEFYMYGKCTDLKTSLKNYIKKILHIN